MHLFCGGWLSGSKWLEVEIARRQFQEGWLDAEVTIFQKKEGLWVAGQHGCSQFMKHHEAGGKTTIAGMQPQSQSDGLFDDALIPIVAG